MQLTHNQRDFECDILLSDARGELSAHALLLVRLSPPFLSRGSVEMLYMYTLKLLGSSL
jgi:hypothetical protein